MKETEILKLDKRGRIVIPRIMRKSLGLTEGSQLMAISDSEKKEIRIIPLQLIDDKIYIKLKITIPDLPGSLGRIAQVFGDHNISLVYGEAVVVKRGIEAEWTVIAPQNPEIPLDKLKEILIEEGNALKVTILESKFNPSIDNEEG
ncbi:MAG: AbrB/MazE/SpoVT family DNA-binding domain-containing protein [Promethearchaeota archaeon]